MTNTQRLLWLLAAAAFLIAVVLGVTEVRSGSTDCGSVLSKKSFDSGDDYASILDSVSSKRECDGALSHRRTYALVLGGAAIAFVAIGYFAGKDEKDRITV